MTRMLTASLLTLAISLTLCACTRRDEAVAPADATSPAATTPVETPPTDTTTPPTTPDAAAAAGTPATPGAPTATDEHFRKMDANGDGSITADEHAAGATSMFATMDADKNGTVTMQEMDASRAAVGGDTHMSSADKIKAIDKNNDGSLSADEHAGGSKDMFDKMDTDKSGTLSPAEMQAGHDAAMAGKQ